MTSPSDRGDRPPIGLLLRTLDSLISEQFDRNLGSRDLSRRQWQLLSTLACGPRTLEDLTAAVHPFLDAAVAETAEAHLAPLRVRRLVSSHDGVYELTDAGRDVRADAARAVQQTRELTVRGLADGDYDRTIATLQTMIANLQTAMPADRAG